MAETNPSQAAGRSNVIELLDLMWVSINKATVHSWERLNHGMLAALYMAIGTGMKFDLGDFAYIASHYSSGRWIGEGWENLYATAIEAGNGSAVESYESHAKRGSIIADAVRPRRYSPAAPYLHHGLNDWKRSKLAVGFCFPWCGADVIVTSFGVSDDETYVIACSHSDGKTHRGKIVNRFRITRADIIAARKMAKGSAS